MFKQPAEFTRRIFYNLGPGYRDIAPWERLLARNLTAPLDLNRRGGRAPRARAVGVLQHVR